LGCFLLSTRLPSLRKFNPRLAHGRSLLRINPQIQPYRLARQLIAPQHCTDRTTLGKVRIELPVLVRLGATEYFTQFKLQLTDLKQPGAVATDRQGVIVVEGRCLLRTAINNCKPAMGGIILPTLLAIATNKLQSHPPQRPVTQPDVVGQRNIHAEVCGMIMVGGRVLGNEFAGYLFALADAVYLAALGVVRREVGGRL